MNLSRPDRTARLDALAASYVLGTLSRRARSRLAVIARTDTAVSQTLRAWEQRLLPFAESAPPITPSPQVWRRIALRLGLDAVRRSERGPWWARMEFWLVATLARDSRTMVVKTVGGAPVPSDKSLELWMLPDGGAPRSLGVLPATGVARITLPALPDVALANVPALAVSLEQAGGSTTGAPQGPVLYTGKVEKLY